MKINPRCDLLIGNRPENDSDNQYLECEDCHRYEICKKHGCVEMCSPEEIREATPNVLEPSYDLINRRIDRMSISEQVKELREFAKNFWITESRDYDVREKIKQAAGIIESLSAKLADMDRSEEECGGGWVYCGDGKNLPQPGKRYRVTALWKDGDFEMRSVYDLVYGADGVWHGESYVPVSFGVVAWKPLEEPYKENLNEQTRKSILGVAQMSDKAWANYRKEQRIARKARRK